MPKRLLLVLALALIGSSGARAAQSLYPVHIERQHGSTLVIEHTPVARVVGVRRLHRTKVVVRTHRAHRVRKAAVRHKIHRKAVIVTRRRLRHDPALAGGCYDGGFVERVAAGALVTLHRDVCEGIAPISWSR
jgi:hypothetical protein